MKTVFRIFCRDLRRILRNPVALIVTLGVCIIPSLYAWFNILANWDPYENTSDISIAIVNNDEGAQAGSMGYINAGDMVVDKLRENTQLGWTFVDEADGIDGVKSGRYYATIVIPSDFTSSLADVLDGDTQKADLDYYVNEKVNAVSPKVTDTGASTIEQQIDDTFAGTVSEVIAERVADGSADALAQAGDAEDTLDARIREAQADMRELSDQLDGTVGSLGTLRTTISSARNTVDGLAGTSDSAAGNLRTALDRLSGTRVQAQDLSKSLSAALADGSLRLGNITSTATGDLGTVASHVSSAAANVSNAVTTLENELAWSGEIEAQLEDIRSLQGSATAQAADSSDSVTIDVNDQLTNIVETELPKTDSLTDDLRTQLDTLKAQADSVQQQADQMKSLSDSLSGTISNTSSALADLQSDIQGNAMPQVDGALDTFSDVGSSLSASLASVGPLLRQTEGILGQLDGTLDQAQTTIEATASQVDDTADGLGRLADDLATIRSSELWKTLEDASGLDPEAIGDFMNGPVKLVENPVYPVDTYGSGVTPFYTNLALWVGGFVLVAIYKLEVDKEDVGDFKPWQGYLGRWLLLNLLGIVQAVVCCVGDILLGIQCLHPLSFVFAGIVESFAYVGFIYALSIAFKHIGKALGVLLVVLQIPGASGTYPIEMMPGFFQALNPWLPFTYGINAMRESIAGYYDGYYWQNLLILLLLLVPISVLVGMGARRHLLNINTLFDRKLKDTDLMISERVPAGEQQFKLSTIIKVIINSKEYSDVLLGRAAKFELMYPVLIKRGFWALIVVPLALLIVMFVVPAKFALLMLWILSLVIICTFLIVVEYMHSRLNEKTQLASYSQDQLLGMLDDKLRDELFAFAPIEKLQLTHETLASRLRSLRQGARDGGGDGASDATQPLDVHESDGEGPDAGDGRQAEPRQADPDRTQPMPRPEDDHTDGGSRDE